MRATQSTRLTVTTALDAATGTETPLFAFPVQVCAGTASTDVKLDRAAPSGAPVDQVYRDQLTGDILEVGDLVKGVRTGDSFTVIPQDQIEAIDEQVSLEDMRVQRACPLSEVPFDRATSFKYLQAPLKGGQLEHYRLTLEGLKAVPPKGKAKSGGKPAMALQVTFTSRTRQKLGVVYADEARNVLVLQTLTFAADVREPDEALLAPTQVAVDEAKVKMVRKVIEGLANVEGVDFDTPEDEAIALKRDLVAAAADGDKLEVASVTPEAKTVSADALAAALDQSLAQVA